MECKQFTAVVATLPFWFCSVACAITSTWDGGGADANWSTAANWTGDTVPASGNDIVMSGTVRSTNTANLGFSVGSLTLNTSDWNINGAALTLNNYLLLNTSGIEATINAPLTLAGTNGTLNTGNHAGNSLTITAGLTAGATVNVAKNGSGTAGNSSPSILTFSGGTVTVDKELNVKNGGLFFAGGVNATIKYLYCNVPVENGITASITLDGYSTVVTLGSGGLTLGGAANSVGKLTVTNGATLHSPTGPFLFSQHATSNVTLTQITGTILTKQLRAGFGGATTFDLVGGSLTNTNDATSFLSNTGSSLVKINNNGSLIWSGTLDLGGGTVTIDLGKGTPGGTLTIGKLVGSGTHHINFNGGTLKANASSTTFFDPLANTTVIIKAGGATIDTNSYDITIAHQLLAGGGGLTKKGTGTLTLNGANTYSGNTSVEAGSLSIGSPYLNAMSCLTLAAGTVINLNYTGTNVIRKLIVNGVVQPAGVYDNSSAFITGSGTLTVSGIYAYDVHGETMTMVNEFETTNFSTTWMADNTYTPLATYKGNTYFVWVDNNAHPWLTKINDSGVASARLDSGDDYQVLNDGHYKFSLGIDKDGYIHVIGGMHNHSTATIENLPLRYQNSYIMYWVSDNPESISAFTFVGNDEARVPPGFRFTYCSFANDMNMELYMSARIYVHAVTHTPGEVGFGLFRYNAYLRQWTALGGYAPSTPVATYKSILWEDNGGASGNWYQGFANPVRFDANNRLHFAATIYNQLDWDASTHLVYAYSDDGGDTFQRADASTIAALPMRADSGSNQADIVAGPLSDAGLTGIAFWDAHRTPAVAFRDGASSTSVYRIWNPSLGSWSNTFASPAGGDLRVMHHLDPRGVITFVASDPTGTLVRATDLQCTTAKQYIPYKYLNAIDQLALRQQGVFRFVSRSGSTMAVTRIEFNKTGSFTEEIWNSISGTSLSNLAADADFPASPDSLREITGPLERTANTADNYGRRLRGFIIPPTSGNYTFYIAGDDNSELWLSSDASISNATRIAYSIWYTSVYQWNKYISQQSQTIALVAGQKYYFEVLQKEGAGGDHVEVAWTGPDFSTPTVIGGAYLSPWAAGQIGAFGQ